MKSTINDLDKYEEAIQKENKELSRIEG